jgi:CrcB protein
MAKELLAVFLGGGLGSVLRVALTWWAAGIWGSAFPWGTLIVNATGSLAIGFLAGMAVAGEGWAASPLGKQFLMIGVLGGYTTFSSFSLQSLQLAQENQWALALGNVLASLLLCLAAVAAGWMLGQIFGGGR